ncbi:MAG: hypothetical protein HYS86_03570, partial [Candidatus Chisholmbacteria bacterium]|nr:hypothetical protein [Candidatus Chisholmbacteria bacterium]
MVNEKFLGQLVISGEDKRLTYLIQERGWKVTYQSTARVFTEGEKSLLTLYKQRTRHSRNSWRSDIKALKEGWVFKHPSLAFHLIDRSVQPFVALVSPVY